MMPRAVFTGVLFFVLLSKGFASDLVIQNQPDPETIDLGDPQDIFFEFDVISTNGDNITYQWKKNNVVLPSTAAAPSTNFQYDNPDPNSTSGGTYTCTATDPTGSITSAGAALTIILPATITKQPVAQQTVIQGGTATFSVTAGGTAPFTYQWLQNDSFFDANATNSTLIISNVPGSDDQYTFSVQVFNDGSANQTNSIESLLLVVVPPTFDDPPPATLAQDIGDPNVSMQTFIDGSTTGNNGGPTDLAYPLTCQWQKNGVSITPASNNTATNFSPGLGLGPGTSTYNFDNNTATGIQMSDAGTYTMVAKNFGGSITSPPAMLLIYPDITNETPGGLNGTITAQVGSNVTFTASAVGTAPLSYQWQYNGTPIPGATSNKFTLHVANDSMGGTYSVLVSNSACAFAGIYPSDLGESDDTLNVPTETNKPSITITNPAAGALWSNSVVTIGGTATDVGQVVSVQYMVNGDSNDVFTATGTNNWTATFTPIIGSNTITAYAVNYDGIQSTNATRSIFYVVPLPFTLLVSGKGTISSNWVGPDLDLDKSYTMTATAATGYKFIGWTDGVTSTNATLTFVMQSNLVIQANFVDGVPPTLAITNPAITSTFSNSPSITVRGTASDNAQVTQVFYELTNSVSPGVWTAANGTTSWSAGVTLAPGVNIFRAYSVDATGNRSTTNSVTITYILTAPMTVLTNGVGSISPNDNGQTLIIGHSYSMTASAIFGKGFTFTNWTGGTSQPLTLLTNGPTVMFTMQSNLVLQANFFDNTKPALVITNPAANAHFTNTSVNIQGTATDNVAVASVYWRLGSGTWNLAAGTNRWTALVNPAAGTNVFSAYAADAAGNLSPTNTLNIIYSAIVTPVVVQSSGEGTITPNYNGQSLGVGQTFSMTAAGTNGFAFTNWTGGTALPLTLKTNGATVTFVMQSNLVLQANFTDVQAPTIAITNPLPGGSLANLSATVGGTAADNFQVVTVRYQMNGGAWTTAAGTNSWSANVNLTAGTNVFSAYSVDEAGNVSATNTVGSYVSLLQPVIAGVTFSNNVVTVSFESVVGANYSLEYENTLNTGWTPLAGSVAGTGGELSLSDSSPPAGERFYRLKAQSP